MSLMNLDSKSLSNPQTKELHINLRNKNNVSKKDEQQKIEKIKSSN